MNYEIHNVKKISAAEVITLKTNQVRHPDSISVWRKLDLTVNFWTEPGRVQATKLNWDLLIENWTGTVFQGLPKPPKQLLLFHRAVFKRNQQRLFMREWRECFENR